MTSVVVGSPQSILLSKRLCHITHILDEPNQAYVHAVVQACGVSGFLILTEVKLPVKPPLQLHIDHVA